MNGWFHRGAERQFARTAPTQAEANVGARLQAAARLLPLPPVDVVHLARTAVRRGRAARRERSFFRPLPVWSAALAVLVVCLSVALFVRRPVARPVVAAVDVHDPIAQLMNGAVSWMDEMLGGKMLNDELRLLIGDAGRLSAAVAGDMDALYPGSPL